jgi:hypothetical protein
MTKKTTILIAFIGLKFLLQFLLLSSVYELQRDEFLHLDQANHLAWGYLSVPPLTSWTSYIIQLLGNSIFGLSSSCPVWRIDNFYSLESYRRIKWKPDCIDIRATCVLFSTIANKRIVSTEFF